MVLAFDVDDTLAIINEPMDPSVAARLRWLQKRSVTVVLASGKPCVYLAGFVRAYLHAEATILIGENGSDIWMNGIMPPSRIGEGVSPEAGDELAEIATVLDDQYGTEIYFQPNMVNVTAFPHDLDALPTSDVAELVEAQACPHVTVYTHRDSVDCMPRGVDKGTALKRVLEAVGGIHETIAVGDSANDIPMFQVAGWSFCVGSHPEASKAADVTVRSIDEALSLIEERLRAGP